MMNRSDIISQIPPFIYFKVLKFPALILMFSGCYYDNQEALYGKPDENCDPVMANYSTDILPILQTYCYMCHSAAAVAGGNGGGNNFEDFTVLQTLALNGHLVGAVSHASGYSPMPKFGNKLSDCNISKITKWVNDGALNN